MCRCSGHHIHMDINICNIEEREQKYRLRTDSNRLLWGGGGSLNMFYWAKTSPSASIVHVVENIWFA